MKYKLEIETTSKNMAIKLFKQTLKEFEKDDSASGSIEADNELKKELGMH